MTRSTPTAGDVLLITGHRWLNVCRLALTARDAGFTVHLLAPPRHPLADLPWVHSTAPLSPVQPGRSIATTIAAHDYELVIPADEVAASALFDAHRRGMFTAAALAVLTRSLGNPATFGIRHSRTAIGALATSAGVTAPTTVPVPDETALTTALAAVGLPAVLKSDGGYGGLGVEIVYNLDEARAAFRRLSARPRLIEGLGRHLLDGEPSYLSPALSRRRVAVSAQAFVVGESTTMSVAAWQGEVLGSVALRALSTKDRTGPATVVEPVSHPDMEFAAAIVARRLGLSGLFGLDFIVSADGTRASLIELNPRATPTAHLVLQHGARPLLELLAQKLGHVYTDAWEPLPSGPITLFPQPDRRGIRDLENVTGGYLDLPADAGIVELCSTPLAPYATPLAALIRRRRGRSELPAVQPVGYAER